MNRLAWYFLLAAVARASDPLPLYEELRHVRVPMRDGIHLDSNVYSPKETARRPVLLVRTPYGKADALFRGYQLFIDHGYTIVVQDVRGRGSSEGAFDALDQEGPDGYDTVDWIARQNWSNGRVGMLGSSYLGIAQWKTALLNNKRLLAIFPLVSGDDDYRDRFYSTGGALKLGHRLSWLSDNLHAPAFRAPEFAEYTNHLPTRTSDRASSGQALAVWQEALNHPSYDDFWKRISVRENIARIKTPVFSVGGWYDNYVESDLDAFADLQRLKRPSRILIGPWAHDISYKFADVDFGLHATANIRQRQLEWFDRWLKPGETFPASAWSDAPVRIFVMGRNEWRDEREWPLARTRYTPLYLSGKGHANGPRADGKLEWSTPRRERSGTFVYDPYHPVPTMGGAVCCNPKVLPWGPLDQRAIERRPDVLVYSTAPLKDALEVTGLVRVVLYASTTAPDTDFSAKLIDVFPDGTARNLTDGLLRLRYRNGLEHAMPVRPGEIFPVTIDAGVTSNVFGIGHRVRLEVSSSNFPRFDRNPNTGRPVAEETTLRVARQTVHFGRRYASHILLPVIPAPGR